MKSIKKIFMIVTAMLLVINISFAQNYKAPKIDATGKIMDADGKHIGSVSKEGVITDASGMKVAYVDGTGSLVDGMSGKKLGKAEKNGTYLPYFAKTKEEGWSTEAPMNGTCLVKDKDGNVKAVVHENYKAFGACAIHCLSNHMKHNEVLDNSKMKADSYTCSMHPDVISDKPGKCPKCGMALTKKMK